MSKKRWNTSTITRSVTRRGEFLGNPRQNKPNQTTQHKKKTEGLLRSFKRFLLQHIVKCAGLRVASVVDVRQYLLDNGATQKNTHKSKRMWSASPSHRASDFSLPNSLISKYSQMPIQIKGKNLVFHCIQRKLRLIGRLGERDRKRPTIVSSRGERTEII